MLQSYEEKIKNIQQEKCRKERVLWKALDNKICCFLEFMIIYLSAFKIGNLLVSSFLSVHFFLYPILHLLFSLYVLELHLNWIIFQPYTTPMSVPQHSPGRH